MHCADTVPAVRAQIWYDITHQPSNIRVDGRLSLQMKPGVFREEYIAIIVRELLRGLEYLHSEGKLHRDIKGASPSQDEMVSCPHCARQRQTSCCPQMARSSWPISVSQGSCPVPSLRRRIRSSAPPTGCRLKSSSRAGMIIRLTSGVWESPPLNLQKENRRMPSFTR